MLEIDGARYSGSGTIVRQAIAYAALTGREIRIRNARARRVKPGLRPQHVRVIEAIGELVHGEAEGVYPGSQHIVFRPASGPLQPRYSWDIGSAGSTTALALALLPVLAFASDPVEVELRGGLFQDFAPSFYHLKFVILPLLRRMGIEAEIEMKRPGYVPRGQGILSVRVRPVRDRLGALVADRSSPPRKIWGIALCSRLADRKVSHRMAEAALKVLNRAGHDAEFDLVYDETALQPGAALAIFADLEGGWRLGADLAGAPARRSEDIGRRVARALLEEMSSGATLDRYASDQIIPFASLADGESRFLVPGPTDHIESGVWLSREFLGAEVEFHKPWLVIRGVGFKRS